MESLLYVRKPNSTLTKNVRIRKSYYATTNRITELHKEHQRVLRIATKSQNIKKKLLSNDKGKGGTLTIKIHANTNMIRFTQKNRVKIHCS